MDSDERVSDSGVAVLSSIRMVTFLCTKAVVFYYTRQRKRVSLEKLTWHLPDWLTTALTEVGKKEVATTYHAFFKYIKLSNQSLSLINHVGHQLGFLSVGVDLTLQLVQHL